MRCAQVGRHGVWSLIRRRGITGREGARAVATLREYATFVKQRTWLPRRELFCEEKEGKCETTRSQSGKAGRQSKSGRGNDAAKRPERVKYYTPRWRWLNRSDVTDERLACNVEIRARIDQRMRASGLSFKCRGYVSRYKYVYVRVPG